MIDGLQKLLYFNPRPREEGDVKMIVMIDVTPRFQSTPS